MIPLLEHFNKWTSKSIIRQWRILIWDEYNPHTNYEVRDWCWKHHIVPFTLATHLLQPLDVVCFQPYKYYHRQALNRSLRLGIFDFNRLYFIAAFNDMRLKTFKKSTILSAFEKTGLIPYNPEKVLDPLREKLQKKSRPTFPTSSSVSSHTTASTWPTPYKTSDMRDYATRFCNILESIETSPSLSRRFDRFVTASLTRVIAGAEAEKTLCEHKKEIQERPKWQSGTRKVIAKDRVLTGDEAVERIRSRRMDEIEQAQRIKQPHGRRGNPRKILKCKLDFIAALYNPHRSIPPSERALRT